MSRTRHSGLLSGRMNVDIVVVNRGERTGVIGNERCPRIGRDLESIEVCAGDARGVVMSRSHYAACTEHARSRLEDVAMTFERDRQDPCSGLPAEIRWNASCRTDNHEGA